MNTRDSLPMPDVQGARDTRKIAIDRVGIRSIRHPVRIATRDGQAQHTVATFSMSVALPEHQRGTHMSRFVAILNTHERAVSAEAFRALLGEMIERLEAQAGSIEMSFTYFVEKAAPVTGVKSLLDYSVSFLGTIEGGVPGFAMQVVVPVTSLCPCSKEISEYGAHNQRSHITITAHTEAALAIEDLIGIAEREASSELYGLLKRPDEKLVTERAYDNPKFVEDLVRDVAGGLDRDPRISAYRVECENFESIHNHSAWASISRDKRP